MHEVDQTTEQMVRSVLAYAENRLRMSPVPLDRGTQSASDLYHTLDEVIRARGRSPDEVLGVYSSVIAPSIISADSPRFLGFIPAAPTKASLLFDMLVSCASIQGISWLEASGAIDAENTLLRLIADEAGLPGSAGGCFVSGGSAGNLSALAVARETTKRRLGEAAAGRKATVDGGQRRPFLDREHPAAIGDRCACGPDTGPPDDGRHGAVRPRRRGRLDRHRSCGLHLRDDLAGVGAIAKANDWWFRVDGAYGGSGIFAPWPVRLPAPTRWTWSGRFWSEPPPGDHTGMLRQPAGRIGRRSMKG